MFEDRRKIRKRRYVIAAVVIVLTGLAFAVGYYLNIGENADAVVPDLQSKVVLPIPDSLLNPVHDNNPAEEVNEEDPPTTAIDVSGGSDLVDEDTSIHFRTYFTLCGHSIERTALASEDEIGMTELQLRAKYRDWKLVQFSKDQARFEKEIETHCPRHYIIGISNGYIAIYVYNEKGEKTLKEVIDTPVSVLTPEDQKMLESGIIADTEADLEIKLEGFSE